MNPIYKPKGAAKEYSGLAVNIYTGCPHRCYYCFAPSVLRRDKEVFHTNVKPRAGIVEAINEQVKREGITNKLIHLCFTCDPYPRGCWDTPTREVIKLIKDSGNHVQILTKNGQNAMRDFDLLDENDRFGITYAGYKKPDGGTLGFVPEEEPNSGSIKDRLNALQVAHGMGIYTWISCEPILDADDVLQLMSTVDYVDLWKIGKLNYFPSNINWVDFGKKTENLLQSLGKSYYIKDSLRAIMNKKGEQK